ncbi:SDR family oxidoreductase [Conexibacter sp. JD483]|uniref:SDR family NAD(P)-dependent oxidoreductase n=1 Tax=unclassified Conexibacter TaxID=2627773 RepID=UPI00271A49DE|nr:MULTISPECIES: SDR family oxidoreductase [unclassified Conexibacter]MDO8185259.1 SDR family oxidoreductase [Conexibacter sp. CPCC 205706]MDO8198305.1 SDR family oxidoreductase [Conexibacter sp. CPCC 205762]MDR9367734.1 SDR family oxidoreductase [Conexibacter sp. JD483]
MDLDLAGRTAVVTGASRGIGLEIVCALVAEGVTVVAGARTPTDELRALTDRVVAVDLALAGGPEELIAAALADGDGIDLLVNNVGGNPAPFDGFLSVTDEHWDHVLELNLMSTVRATRAALPSLVQRRGAIVNVASANAHLAQPVVVAYAAAKAAMLNLGKALADEFGPQGVRVNTISPGPTLTSLWTAEGSAGAAMATAMGLTQQQLIEQLPAMAGMTNGAMTDPAEVAALVLLLASGAAPSMRGAELVIDGGLLKAV